MEHERPSRWACAGAARAGRFPWVLASGDLVGHRYIRGHGRGAHGERRFSCHSYRRVASVGCLRARNLVGVLPRGGAILLRNSGRVRDLCRGRRGLSVPGNGESNGHGPLILSCHGPCPCLGLGPYPYPHDDIIRGRDGLGERNKSSDDVLSHRDGGENAVESRGDWVTGTRS